MGRMASAPPRSATSPHTVLGLCSTSSLADVRRAYRKLALQHHPDRGGDPARFRELTDAFEQLVDSSSSLSAAPQLWGGDSDGFPSRCADNVRAILPVPGRGWMVVDEQRVLMGDKAAFHAEPGGSFLCACVLDDGSVAVGSSNGVVHVYGHEGAAVAIALDSRAAVTSLCEVGDGVVLACVDGRAALVNLISECELRTVAVDPELHVETSLRLPSASAPSADDVSARAEVLAPVDVVLGGVGGPGGGQLVCVRIDDEYDESGHSVRYRAHHDAPIYALCASAARSEIFAAAAGARVALHDAASGDQLLSVHTGGGVLYALAFSPSGVALVAAGSDELVHAYDVPAGTKRATIRLKRGVARDCALNTACVNALAFESETSFYSGGYDAAVTHWTLAAPPSPETIRKCAECPMNNTCEKGRSVRAVLGLDYETVEPPVKEVETPRASPARVTEESLAACSPGDLLW